MKNQQLTLHEHIRELRRRLFWSVLVFLAGGTIGYVVHKPLIALLRRPLHETLYYTSPAGGFNFVMKICMMVGLAIAVPVLVYHLIEFIRPAFGSDMRKHQAHSMAALSFVLALSGIIFGFFVVVPMSLKFFHGFSGNGIQSLLSATDYLEFVTNHLITFIIIFQLPLILLFIDRIRPLPPKTLLKYDKHIIIGAAAISLILPFTYDPVSQFLVGLPIVVLYNLTIILVFFRHRKRGQKAHRHSPLVATARPKPVLRPAPIASLEPLAAPVKINLQTSMADVSPRSVQPKPQPVQRSHQPTYQRRIIMDVQPRRLPGRSFGAEAEAA